MRDPFTTAGEKKCVLKKEDISDVPRVESPILGTDATDILKIRGGILARDRVGGSVIRVTVRLNQRLRLEKVKENIGRWCISFGTEEAVRIYN